MACLSFLPCASKHVSPYTPEKGAPSLLTSKAQVKFNVKSDQNENAAPRKPGRKMTPWPGTVTAVRDDDDNDRSDIQVTFDPRLSATPSPSLERKKARKSTPWHRTRDTCDSENESVDVKYNVKWDDSLDVREIDGLDVKAEMSDSVVTPASAARRYGRKATPFPGSFKATVDEQESDEDSDCELSTVHPANSKKCVQWADCVSVHNIDSDVDSESEVRSGSSERRSGRKATPFPGSLEPLLDQEGDQSCDPDEMDTKATKGCVRWEEEEQVEVAKPRRSARKGTPWHGGGLAEDTPATTLPDSDDLDDTLTTAEQAAMAYANMHAALLPNWFRCWPSTEQGDGEILIAEQQQGYACISMEKIA